MFQLSENLAEDVRVAGFDVLFFLAVYGNVEKECVSVYCVKRKVAFTRGTCSRIFYNRLYFVNDVFDSPYSFELPCEDYV